MGEGISQKCGSSRSRLATEDSSSINSSSSGVGAGWARLSPESGSVGLSEAERVTRSVAGATNLVRFLVFKSGTGFTLLRFEDAVG